MENHCITTVKKADVKIGMYVILPLAWHEHPFLKNQFLVKSDCDIKKLQAMNMKEITVDCSRSEYVFREPYHEDAGSKIPMPNNELPKVDLSALKAAILDDQAPPRKKAMLIRQGSEVMMKNLLDNPTAENIREAKKGITDIINLILTEEQTLHYLLNITSHDFYTYTHSVNVGILAVALAKSLFKDSRDHDIHALGAGFFLHDLGKVGIDVGIINKPGKLNDDEMREIHKHPHIGFKLLYDTQQITDESKIIVLQHHERVDGTGYPKKLMGNDIHIYARICAIADVYDALTSERPYKRKMSPFDALKLMSEEMMNHFQKELFEQFVKLFKPLEGNRLQAAVALKPTQVNSEATV